MRGYLVLVPFLLTSGCGAAFENEKAVEACEQFIKAKLLSPSTYKRIDVVEGALPVAGGEGPNAMISIEYDAANAFGTPLRDRENCLFSETENGPDTQGLEDPIAAKIRATSIELKYVQGEHVDDFAPCCLPLDAPSAPPSNAPHAPD